MFRIVSEIMGAIPVFVKRNADLSLNVEEIRKRINNRTRAIFLCSPNNPTGDTISEETARGIIELTDATVVIDEAYFEFCGKTLASLTEKYENVVIIRTFSKAFSMAGVRVGFALIPLCFISWMNAKTRIGRSCGPADSFALPLCSIIPERNPSPNFTLFSSQSRTFERIAR